ncbi:nitroreductase family protein [Niallia taxi]|uniref:nitroreductase family protein n=1 Tax=Niallia taxi TaxID=2499688 RepID=UPI001CD9375A
MVFKKTVPLRKILKILDEATWSPTLQNREPWHIYSLQARQNKNYHKLLIMKISNN